MPTYKKNNDHSNDKFYAGREYNGTKSFFKSAKCNPKPTKATDSEEPNDYFQLCTKCTEHKLDENCTLCKNRLTEFLKRSACCPKQCLLLGYKKDGNTFSSMNYCNRIRRDLFMHVNKKERLGHFKSILLRKCFDLLFILFQTFH